MQHCLCVFCALAAPLSSTINGLKQPATICEIRSEHLHPSTQSYRVKRCRPKSATLPNGAAAPPCKWRVRLRGALPVAGALSAEGSTATLQQEASTLITVVKAGHGTVD